MSRRLVLPPPAKEYKQTDERLRNREIETVFRAMSEKIAELESRIYALENP